MKYTEVIDRFVERYYNPNLKEVKSGNYSIQGDSLYLFGNRIAFYESDHINTDYRGPYSGSRTTKKALNYLKWLADIRYHEKTQAMLDEGLVIDPAYWLRRSSIPDELISNKHCNHEDSNVSEKTTVSIDGKTYPIVQIKIKIGAPTNSEQVYLEGDGVECGEFVVAHALPVYRQKDYPVYKTRKNGPYCVSLKNSGIRISGTNQKLVFKNLQAAAEFGHSVSGLYALLGFPMSEEDPRKILEFAKEHREELYEPMTSLAAQYGGVLVTPEAAAKADEE
jgi:hypothetical protein